MLRNRLITAAVLIPLVVAGTLWIPSDTFALLVGLLALLAAREMSVLAGFGHPAAQAMFVAAVAAGLFGVSLPLQLHSERALQSLAALAWIVATILLVMRRRPVEPVIGPRPGILLLCWVILVVAWCSLTTLHQRPVHGPSLVLFLFVLIWTADSGAYFAGRALGKRKLSPAVSPGKTWAGVAGAMAGALICALVLHQLELVDVALPALLLLCLLVTAVSIGGDLFESLLKRQAQVKDSGTLLPGHGGALDRVDSLLAAAPLFVAGLRLLESFT